jgi:hypothetical protein
MELSVFLLANTWQPFRFYFQAVAQAFLGNLAMERNVMVQNPCSDNIPRATSDISEIESHVP